jgi:hypothetical protein
MDLSEEEISKFTSITEAVSYLMYKEVIPELTVERFRELSRDVIDTWYCNRLIHLRLKENNKRIFGG